MENLPKDKQKALKDIRIELDNIQEYVIDNYNNLVFKNPLGIVPHVEINIEDMTSADELQEIACDINALYDRLEQTMSKLYK